MNSVEVLGSTCQCWGQCARHENRCTNIFGQGKLFEAGVDMPTKGPRTGTRLICPACAPTFDPQRAARERRAAQAYTEQSRAWDEFVKRA